jgi:hypothetical protein
VRFAPGELAETLDRLPEAVVRPSSGIAYIQDETVEELPDDVAGLVAAIRSQLDPHGVFTT